MPDDKSMFVRIEKIETLQQEFKKDATRRLENLESSKSTLEKLAAITELHIKQIIEGKEKQELREERQDLFMQELSRSITTMGSEITEVMGNMNTNLTNLNTGQEKLANGQDELEKRMDKYEERGKIDLWEVTKKTGAIILTIVVTYFATTLGLK